MDSEKKVVPSFWRTVAIAALCCCALLCGLYFSKPASQNLGVVSSGTDEATTDEGTTSDAGLELVTDDEDPLSAWVEGSAAKQALIDYVESVTDESSPDFIPVEDRVATFDVDGTLINETDPNYFDYTMLAYRVLEDPNYKDQASDFEKSVANKIVDLNENGTKYSELPVEHGQAVASAFKGFTIDEFYDYVHMFAETDMPSYENMKRGEAFYVPMVQVVKYLQDNGFDVYMVSGTDRLIMRGLFSSELCPITTSLDHVMGSDETLVGSKQEGEDGLGYTFGQDEQLVLGGDFLMKTLKENKVYIIQREIAKQPVLSFGNTSGDFAMDNYALSNPKYKSAAFQLCCDDLERENGNQAKADAMYADCEANGYIPVSMKNDWVTIYPEGVVYTGAAEVVADAA